MIIKPTKDLIDNSILFDTNSIFKFVPFERLDFFPKGGYLRFTSPFLANDKFEFFTIGLDYNAMLGTVDHPKSKYHDKIISHIGFPNEFANPISLFGCLSLTKEIENHLMWAHYSRNFEGFAFEFDSLNPFFSNCFDMPTPTIYEQINYSDYTPHLTDAELDKLLEIKTKIETNTNYDVIGYPFHIYFTKSKYWEYEKEYRLIKPLNCADKVIEVNKDDKYYQGRSDIYNIHLFKIPFDAVKSIILGMGTHPELAKHLYELINKDELLKHIRIIQSVNPIYQYKILFKEYKPT